MSWFFATGFQTWSGGAANSGIPVAIRALGARGRYGRSRIAAAITRDRMIIDLWARCSARVAAP
jgi:hypothetical protein